MGIGEQFNKVAEEYDANRRRFIPCFDEFYDETTAFIAASIGAPRRIADLGAGTGLLSYYWHRHFPKAEFVLTDLAEDMLGVARRRFEGLGNFSFPTADYTKELPGAPYDAVISALSIHHLEDGDKEKLFSDILKALPEGGVFVNYDQFCAGEPMLDKAYDSFWEDGLYRSGLTERDIAMWQERRSFDRECSVEQETDMLARSGFRIVKCVYSCRKFAVIMAVK